jgi:hypothetical protein
MTSLENERMGGLPVEVRDYAQLVRAIRTWIAELGTAGETIDDVAGLPLRYTMKLLAPVPVKGIGRTSLGPLLGALGLKLVVAVDHEVLARIRHRLIARHASSTMLLAQGSPRKTPYLAFKDDPDLALVFRQRQLLGQSPRRRRRIARDAKYSQSPEERSENARIAAKARWAKVREVRV